MAPLYGRLMPLGLLFLLLAPLVSVASAQTDVFVNEVHYDNESTDTGEAIEVAGPASVDLAGWSLVLYNGNGGSVYGTQALSGTIPDGCDGYGTVAVTYPANGLQNGPDGVALVDASGAAVQFLSYEGSFTATDGPASGLTSQEIGAEETGSTPIGASLQLVGTGTAYEDFAWSAEPQNTFGDCNTGQIFGDSGPVGTDVVINEIDSDTPGSDDREFIELFDGGAGNTPLDGLVVVLYNGSSNEVYDAIDLSGFATDADGYFLLGNAAVTPSPALTFSIGTLQNGPDAVALYAGSAAAFPNGTPVTTDNLLDAVVYGTGDPDDPELLALLNPGQPQVDEDADGNKDGDSIQRVPNGSGGARNTDVFAPFPPTPGTENTGSSVVAVAEIFEIQTAGLESPFADAVVTTEGNVVTAIGPEGFFIQTPDVRADLDVETSNGIYVFTGDAPTVSVGDLVDVTGEVVEFFGFTEITGNPEIAVTASGQPLPAPLTFDAQTPSPDQPQPENELERYEGMRVQVTGGTATAPADRFGDVYVVADPTRTYRAPGIAFPGLPGLPVWDGNPEIFEIDPEALDLPSAPIAAGATVSATGPLAYAFGDYQIWPVELQFENPEVIEPVRAREPGEVTVGTLNMLRLFDTADDPDTDDPVPTSEELAERFEKFSLLIRKVMGAPDVLAVQEVENLDVLQAVATKIQADDPSIVYDAYLEEGNDVGGIDVGFLIRRDAFEVTDVTQLAEDETLSVDGSPLHDRPPLLLEGRFTGGSEPLPVQVLVVHNRSLSGIDDPSRGPRVRQKRLEQAQSIARIVQGLQEADSDVHLVVTGDFNAYEFTDGYVHVVGRIQGDFDDGDDLLSGPDLVEPNLTNQVLSLPPEERYSFIFQGSAQALDHVLTSEALDELVTGIQYARANADAPERFIDDPATPLRTSDHDGLVLFLSTVSTPPEELAVRLTSVENGAKVESGLNLVLAANVTGDAEKVIFRANGRRIGVDRDGSDGWRIVWTGLPTSNVRLRAVARSAGGERARSEVVKIKVREDFEGKTGTVAPIFECVAPNADGTLTARFGYENYTQGATVQVPLGSHNKLTPSDVQGEPVTQFTMPNLYDDRPGRTAFGEGAFSITFNPAQTANIVWTLLGRTSTAGAHSQRCDEGISGRAAAEALTSSGLADVPEAFAFHPNYPNPFNPTTEIRFDLPEAADVRLVVYDVMGREVARLAEGNYAAGRHRATFNASGLPSGVYFGVLTAADIRAVQRMVLMK